MLCHGYSAIILKNKREDLTFQGLNWLENYLKIWLTVGLQKLLAQFATKLEKSYLYIHKHCTMFHFVCLRVTDSWGKNILGRKGYKSTQNYLYVICSSNVPEIRWVYFLIEDDCIAFNSAWRYFTWHWLQRQSIERLLKARLDITSYHKK